jgi:hypothetical protein
MLNALVRVVVERCAAFFRIVHGWLRSNETKLAAASGSARGCGLKGFSHVKSEQYDGSPSAAGNG